MYTTYHLTSAQEIDADFIDAIKATFKSKPITIIVQEEEGDFELSTEMKEILDERLEENQETYLSSETSINQLSEKYGL